MEALFSRLKNWNAENLTNEDLNAEIDNILDNLTPAGMDDYSTNVAALQTNTDPGEVGTESLPTTLGGELERLRYVVKEIKGTSQWYESSTTSLAELTSALGTALLANRISTGSVRTNSNQANFLVAEGSGTQINLEGATTTFTYFIEGTSYTISTDINATGLQTAPSSNNTALVNDPSANNGNETRYLGMYETEINIDTVGSEITSLIGEYAGFKINDGIDDEYFIAKVRDATTLVDARRGYFMNSSNAAVPAIPFANNDTITLMKLTWVFANTVGGLAVTYNNPRVGPVEPSSPSIGDYWFDTTAANNKWRTFNSTIWVDADAIFVGMCLQDTTNTVVARSADISKTWSSENNIVLTKDSASEIRGTARGQLLSVGGLATRYESDVVRFNMATDLESGETESSSTVYYLYVTGIGGSKISTKPPVEFAERLGIYHPDHMWRAVGKFLNDGSSNIDGNSIVSYAYTGDRSVLSNDVEDVGSLKMWVNDSAPPGWLICDGSEVSRYEYAELYRVVGDNFGNGDTADTFDLLDPEGRFVRFKDNAAGRDPDAGSRTAMNTGGLTGDNVGTIQSYAVHNHAHIIKSGNFNPGGNPAFFWYSVTGATLTDGTQTDGGGSETRPISFNINLIVKAVK